MGGGQQWQRWAWTDGFVLAQRPDILKWYRSQRHCKKKNICKWKGNCFLWTAFVAEISLIPFSWKKKHKRNKRMHKYCTQVPPFHVFFDCCKGKPWFVLSFGVIKGLEIQAWKALGVPAQTLLSKDIRARRKEHCDDQPHVWQLWRSCSKRLVSSDQLQLFRRLEKLPFKEHRNNTPTDKSSSCWVDKYRVHYQLLEVFSFSRTLQVRNRFSAERNVLAWFCFRHGDWAEEVLFFCCPQGTEVLWGVLDTATFFSQTPRDKSAAFHLTVQIALPATTRISRCSHGWTLGKTGDTKFAW